MISKNNYSLSYYKTNKWSLRLRIGKKSDHHPAEMATAKARDHHRLEFRIRANTVTLYECHAPWQPGEPWSGMPSAQFRVDLDAPDQIHRIKELQVQQKGPYQRTALRR